tara:strand:- start:19340 stop:20011 length:672 start_codon:yes stop_codon:yes gene_type:complete
MSKYNAAISKTVKQPAKGKYGQGTKLKITNAMVMYVKNVGYGGLKFGEAEVEDKPWMNRQYELDVLITEDIADALKEIHSRQGIKEKTLEQFKETYKVDPPYEAKKYYVTKFYKEAFYKNGSHKGEEAPRTSFVSDTGSSLEEVGIGNGSVANLIVNASHYKNDFGSGTSMRLGSVQITDLIEYSLGGSDDLDEFDFVEAPPEPTTSSVAASNSNDRDDDWDE